MRNSIGKIIFYMSQIRFQKSQVLSLKQEYWEKALLSLYYSLIYPYLTYCCQVWGATYLYDIEILNRLQKM